MGASLKRAQRRSLRAIERDLSADDPRLTGMFLTFSRLNRGEELPGTVRPRARTARRAWLRVKGFAAACFIEPEPIDARQPWLGP